MADSPAPFKSTTTLQDIIDDFGANTTAHGIPRVITATKLLSKVLWILVCSAAFSLFIIQSIDILEDYLTYPTTTKVELVPKSEVEFPSVTVCNMNRLRRSALTGTRFEDLIEIDGGFDQDYQQWFGSYVEWSSNDNGGGRSDYINGAWVGNDGLQGFDNGDVSLGGGGSLGDGGGGGLAGSDNTGGLEGSFDNSGSQEFGDNSGTQSIGGNIFATQSSSDNSETQSTGGTIVATQSSSDNSGTQSIGDNIFATQSSSDNSETQSTGGTIIATQSSSDNSGTQSTGDNIFTTQSSSGNSGTQSTGNGDSGTTRSDSNTDGGDGGATGGDDTGGGSDRGVTGGGGDNGGGGFGGSTGGDDVGGWSEGSAIGGSGNNGGDEGFGGSTGGDNGGGGGGFGGSTGGDDSGGGGFGGSTGGGNYSGGGFGGSTGGGDYGGGGLGGSTGSGGSMAGGYGSYNWYTDSYFDWFDFDYYGSLTFTYENYYNWGDIEDPNDWRGIYDNSQTEDFSDVIKALNPTKEELREYGHQANEFILQCTFDKRQCNYTDFLQFQNVEFGNCYTFNHGTGVDVLRNTSQTGAQFGLHLTLLIEQPKYVGLLTHDVGVRVSVHPPTIAPHPEDNGIAAETGTSTSIGLRQTKISRKDGKYGNCSNHQPGGKEHRMYHYEYSYPSCKKICLQDQLYEKCGCVTNIYIEGPKCNFLNQTQQVCQQLIESLVTEDKLDCPCPLRCKETSYLTSISTSLWPSERYQDHLYRRVSDRNYKVSNIIESFEKTRKNLVRLKVFFEDLNFQSINEVPIYSTASLLGSLGGLLGLYIGLSTITMVEIIILFIDIIRFTMRKIFCRNRVMALNT